MTRIGFAITHLKETMFFTMFTTLGLISTDLAHPLITFLAKSLIMITACLA